LVEVQSARFLAPVQPGDLLESTCECLVLPDRQHLIIKALCSVACAAVAEVKLRFRLEVACA
jgi:hypothetical protein